jgi:hypothetical protein
MDWQGALRARLIAAASVTALVAQRVYWVDRPQASALPAITLQTISEARPQHLKGFDGLSASRVQIDCWAPSHIGSTQLADAVIAAVVPENTANGIHFDRAFIDSIRDLGERVETQFIHRASIDLIFHHTTA